MEPLEQQAWNGRWLAIVFRKPTETVPAHYDLDEIRRAANQADAAMLAREKYSLADGTHLMVVALPAEIMNAATASSAVLEMPGPRWYRINGTLVSPISEDAWLRETMAEWTFKAEPPTATEATP